MRSHAVVVSRARSSTKALPKRFFEILRIFTASERKKSRAGPFPGCGGTTAPPRPEGEPVTIRRTIVGTTLVAPLAAIALAAAGPPVTAATWAPAASAAIHPGVQTYTNGGQCTANFIYSDGANT